MEPKELSRIARQIPSDRIEQLANEFLGIDKTGYSQIERDTGHFQNSWYKLNFNCLDNWIKRNSGSGIRQKLLTILIAAFKKAYLPIEAVRVIKPDYLTGELHLTLHIKHSLTDETLT